MKLLEQFRLTKEQISKFERYLDLLLEWNSKFNLTAITEKDEIEEVLTLRTDWQQEVFASELERCLYRFLEEKKAKAKKAKK